MQNKEISLKIAEKTLRNNYRENGIIAGTHHFDDYWARDSFYASWGALELKDYDIVKKNLELFLGFQKNYGQIPIRVGASNIEIGLKVFGIKTMHKNIPRYSQDKGKNSPTDQNSLLIITFYNYIRKTKDLAFLKENIDRLEKTMQWNFSHDNDHDLLIEEGFYATWADNLKKKGKVLYTNVLHCHALKCISELYLFNNNGNQSNKYDEFHQQVKNKINELFWNKTQYLDWIDEKKHDYFSTDGNLLAILFKIANKEQCKKIQETLEWHGINNYVPCLTNMPKYPFKYSTSIINLLIGIPDYHNGICWTWLGCLDALAKHGCGMKKDAVEVMERISNIIINDKQVYEVYEQSGKPVQRLFYKSEYDFSWSAGLFILAYNKIK